LKHIVVFLPAGSFLASSTAAFFFLPPVDFVVYGPGTAPAGGVRFGRVLLQNRHPPHGFQPEGWRYFT